ncbi:MAG: energy transducer TonB [Planctomycetes bacterium]|nr:energy transducer TonB [Planctomycetota bacterium]
MRTSFLTVSVLLHVAVLGIASVVAYGHGNARKPAQVQLQFSEEVPVQPPVERPVAPVTTEQRFEFVLPEIDVVPVLPEPEPDLAPVAELLTADVVPPPTAERVAPLPPPPAEVVPTPEPKPITPPPVQPSAHVDATPLVDRNQPPEYPSLARQLGQQGTVRIRVHLDDRGDVLDAEVAEPCAHAELNRAALRAVRRWKFAPATEDGVPIADSIVVPVVFLLTDA